MPAPSRVLLAGVPRTIRSAIAAYQRSTPASSPLPVAPGPPGPSGPTGPSDTELSDASLLSALDANASLSDTRASEGNGHDRGKGKGQGKEELYGWVRSVRAHKNVAFAEVDDGTARVQSVLKGKGRADGLSIGSSVKLTGRLQPSKGKGQEMEFDAHELSVLGECDPATYPIQKKALPLPYLRDHAHLRFRTAHTAAVMRVRDGLMREWHDWFEENEFTHIHTPILTSSDCEGAGEVFTLAIPPIHHPSSASSSPHSSSSSSSTSSHHDSVPFFPTRTNLTVSAQLHLEAPTHSLARTYTLSPSFRAEPSLTSRHLSEFYMLEGEVAFAETLDGLMDLVEDGLRRQAERIMWGAAGAAAGEGIDTDAERGQRGKRYERIRKDLETISATQAESEQTTSAGAAETDFEARLERAPLAHLVNLAARPFTRISYSEAIRLCRQHAQDEAEAAGGESTGLGTFTKVPSWEDGLGTEHEKWLAAHFDGPVFITHYPRAVKPFYMLPSEADPSFASTYGASNSDVGGAKHADANGRGDTVACFDLVLPSIGELVGGSLREYRHAHLLDRMRKLGMKEEEYQWYLDLRKYGSVPHGGWGMGFDRWVCWVTGVGNVRDVVPFPRWRGNCRY